jgi:hypothetical protein
MGDARHQASFLVAEGVVGVPGVGLQKTGCWRTSKNLFHHHPCLTASR